MATYQINTGTTVPQLKDSIKGQTFFNQYFNSNISQKNDLSYGANNNDAIYRFNNTIYYSFNLSPISYTINNINNDSKVITITNSTLPFKQGHYNYLTNSFNPPLQNFSYPLAQNVTIGTFAPSFPIVIFS